MKIDRLVLKNVTSFKEEVVFDFDAGINILIGPNGGGKTNTLRVLSYLLTKYLLPPYAFTNPAQNHLGTPTRDEFNRNEMAAVLDKYVGDATAQSIILKVRVEKGDLENLRAISTNADELARVSAPSPIKPCFSWTDEQIDEIEAAGSFEYRFEDHLPVEPSVPCPALDFLNYLKNFFLIARLAERVEGLNLRSPFFFFSSVRPSDATFGDADTGHFREKSYHDQLLSVYRAAAGKTTNLLQFSTHHFGRLMWGAIRRAASSTQIATDLFEQEPDVQLVRKYLRKLGYEWNLVPIDSDEMKFRMEFVRGGLVLKPGKFSSGEREIFHFLFAAFALNVEDGLIIVDSRSSTYIRGGSESFSTYVLT